jgi:hypothetical protein
MSARYLKSAMATEVEIKLTGMANASVNHGSYSFKGSQIRINIYDTQNNHSTSH